MQSDIRAVLKTRAAETARPPKEPEYSDAIDVVRFGIGSEVYAFEAAFLSEAQRFREPTPVPYVPGYILGILYMRGRFVSVVDLKRFLGLDETAASPATSLLLLSDEKREFALAVDSVLDERKLPLETLQPLAHGFVLERRELIRGVTEEGSVLLDAKRFLHDPSMQIHQEITTSHQRGSYVQ